MNIYVVFNVNKKGYNTFCEGTKNICRNNTNNNKLK